MEKLIALFAFLLTALPLTASAEPGNITNFKTHGQWSSFRLCGADKCVWRASTISGMYSLAIDYYDDLTYGVSVFVANIPQENLNTWASDTDFIEIDLRVDKRTLYNLGVSRQLERSSRTLFYNFSAKELGYKFIEELEKGYTLRMRSHVNGETFINSFSLKGASAAINRASVNSANQNTKDRKSYSEEDEYFNDSTTSI